MRRVLFPTLQGYQRRWLTADLLAGLTLLVIAVPEQIATSRLAGVPPTIALYAFVAAVVAFAAFGSNPRLSVGADSTIAPLFAAGVARFAPVGSTRYAELVALLALVVGVVVALVGVLRLGWIADFLSAPIITGFLCGVAVIIVIHQLPDFLGIPPVGGSTLHQLAHVITHVGDANAWTVAIGTASLALIVGSERLHRRLPGALIAVVAATALVAAADLTAHGVAVLGSLSTAVPHVGVRGLSWSSLRDVVPIALVVALVVVSQTAATTVAFPEREGHSGDVDRDFIGVGAGNVLAGLVGSIPVNASPPRTAAVVSSGGKTQVAGLGAAVAVVALIPTVGLLKNLPLTTLAAILFYIAGRIFRTRDLAAIARFDRFEFGLALVTLLTVAAIGIEVGIGVAVTLAIVDRARITARPRNYLLGRIPGTTSWEPLGHHEHPAEVPGVVVALFASPLYFANADHFRHEMRAALRHTHAPVSLFVLDAAAMSDIDFTGARALRAVLDELERDDVAFAVARAVGNVPTNLERSGLLRRIGRDHLFHTVDEAVRTLGPGTGSGTPEEGT
ncbi:MAG TPA: SulP family inorganic anion transporter, partial [Acidimicrobiales bacterium]|nr:SulP family inorganic anion transporter [Acidimicrobiales bacterium]